MLKVKAETCASCILTSDMCAPFRFSQAATEPGEALKVLYDWALGTRAVHTLRLGSSFMRDAQCLHSDREWSLEYGLRCTTKESCKVPYRRARQTTLVSMSLAPRPTRRGTPLTRRLESQKPFLNHAASHQTLRNHPLSL